MEQILTFTVNNELYGLSVSSVSEILELPLITRVPGMPDSVKGVINIRGAVVPVLDLNQELGDHPTEETKDTSIIVAEMTVQEEEFNMGLLVDLVHQVISLEPEHLDTPPGMEMFNNAGYVKAVGKYDDRFIIILDAASLPTVLELVIQEKII